MNRKTKIVKTALKEALLDLLEEKPLTEISVRKLCDIADVNRSTFYAHYEDINALVSEMEDDFLSHFVFFDGTNPSQEAFHSLMQCIEYVKENQRMYLLLLKNGKLYDKFLLHSLDHNYQEIDPDFHAILVAYSVIGSLSAMVCWLRHPRKYTEQDVAQLLYRASCAIAEMPFYENKG